MAYVKNIWVDQDVERPKTYEVTNNQDGSITLTDSFGLVTELGTPVNETNMNHIEDGIDGCAIRKHNLTETFNLGEWVLGGTGDDEGIYKSLVANNVGNAISDDTKWEKVEMGGNSRNIGEIVASTIPLTDAGLHLLDGALLQYGSYQAFIDYIADLYDSGNYTAIFDTEANWQSAVAQYGVCGKFVYDSVNNTVRLPKITGFTEGTIDPTVLGDLVEAGLPNITGTLVEFGHGVHSADTDGAFRTTYVSGAGSASGSGLSYKDTTFDASRSSSIYGNSLTVQPQAIKVLYYIVVATLTKTDIEVDIDEIATDLNGKADVDLTNVNNTGKIAIVHNTMPSNTYESVTIGASGASYTATADGYCSFHATATSTSAYLSMYIKDGNDSVIYGYKSNCNLSTHALYVTIPVKKGQTFYSGYGNVSNLYGYFTYAVGNESEA